MDEIKAIETVEETASPVRRLTLRKPEKLRHRQLVGSLFDLGKSAYEPPLRMVWRVLTPEELQFAFRSEVPERTGRLQMLITVPKKKRRHAVDRVLMRRRIREAYRKNRLPLLDYIESHPEIGAVHLALIYLDDKNADYATVESKIRNLLKKAEKRARIFVETRTQQEGTEEP